MIRKYSGDELLIKAEEALKTTKDIRIYKCAMAVYLTAGKKLSNEEAAALLGVKPSTVTKRREQFSRGKYELPQAPRTGNGSHLIWEEEARIILAMTEKAKCGEFTTIHQIKEEYEKAAGCSVGKSTIYRFLARHKWRKIKPRPRHPKTDKEAQEEFKKTAANHAGNQKKS